MNKKVTILLILTIILAAFTSCDAIDIFTGEKTPNKEWDLIEESANGTVVNLYITEQDEKMKSWFSNEFSKLLLEKHDIKLSIKMLEFDSVVETIDNEILNEVENGQIDILVLKDNEFSILKSKSYLYEKITENLPNLSEFMNQLDIEVSSEHGNPLDGYAVAFGKSQYVLMFDEDELETHPKNTDELLTFVKENKKTFTYPNPTKEDVGGKFIRTIIYEIIGKDRVMELINADNITEEELYEMIRPAIDYLVELDKYILKDENEYFDKMEDIDEMFYNGDLLFSMSEDFTNAETGINEEIYPPGARSFVFDSGTVGDSLYLSIPVRSSNKSGSLVLINEILSIDMQLSKYAPKKWGNLPVLDLNLLSEVDAEKFSKVSVKRNTIRVEDLFNSRYPELPMNINLLINDIWDKYVNIEQ